MYLLNYLSSYLVVCLLKQSSQSYSIVSKTVRSSAYPYNSNYAFTLVQADRQARVATNPPTCAECGNTSECGATRAA